MEALNCRGDQVVSLQPDEDDWCIEDLGLVAFILAS